MNNSINTILSQPEASLRILERVNTTNGILTIEETDEYRWIRDNYKAYYSILDKSQPERLVLPYLQSMMAVLLFLPEPGSVLLLGAGGGAILRFLNEYFTDNCILAIDYDENVIKITGKYFLNDNFTQNSIMNIDAIQYISKPSINKFDLMFVDLFAHGTIPDFFNAQEFYENCKKCSGSGIVVFNLIITTESSFKLIMNMILSVFNNRCLCLTVPDYKNIIVLAFTENVAIETDVTTLRTKCENLRKSFNLEFDELLDEIISTNVCLDNKLQL